MHALADGCSFKILPSQVEEHEAEEQYSCRRILCDDADAFSSVTLRPRIALEEKAAKQQLQEKRREQKQRTRQALAELDQARLSKLISNQVCDVFIWSVSPPPPPFPAHTATAADRIGMLNMLCRHPPPPPSLKKHQP